MKKLNLPKQTWDAILITIVLAVVYVIFLGYFPLITPDEGRYAEIAREMVLTHQYLVPHLNFILYFEKPVLFYWLTAFSIKLFGLSEWSVRLWPVIFAVLGCALTYLTTSILYSRAAGFFAAAILSSTLLYFGMGHYANLDMTLTFFLSASLYAFILGTRLPQGSKKRFYFWSSAIAAALAFLTKGLIGFAFPAMIIGLYVLLLNQWRELKNWYLPSSILIFILVAAPWHILLQLKEPSFAYFYFITQQFARYSTLTATRYEPFYFYSLVFMIGFFPWSFFLIQAFRRFWPNWRERKQKTIEYFLLIWFFSILLFFSLSQSQLIPYILPIFPPAAIIVGKYCADARNRRSVGMLLGFIGLALCGILLIGAAMLLPRLYAFILPGKNAMYLLALSFWFLMTVFAAHSWFKRDKVTAALITLMVGFLVFLIACLPVLPSLERRSIKPLAKMINHLSSSDDLIVAYNHYYQDLPFYTQRKIITVNWFVNELKFGIEHQKNAKQWMITHKEFWKLFNSKKRLFVLIHHWSFPGIQKENPKTKFYIIGKTERNILISNQEIKDAKN